MNSTERTTEDPDLTHKSEEYFNDEYIKSLKREGDEDLDKEIIENEVQSLITSLRNNKACGFDKIFNEYLKYGTENIINLIVKIFNVILLKGIFSENWLFGIVKPIYKNKGSKADPGNYRGITLVSCLIKLFTGVINKRLSEYLETNNLLNENQTGFRKNYATLDHIFNLHTIIQLCFAKGKKLYCAFVEFAKAFDTVWRKALWFKLLNSGITGKCLNIIVDMYNGIKSIIELNGNISDTFLCNVGVRQGENLSPLLFAIFLNDFETAFDNCGSIGININELLEINSESVLKLFVLLYANDTVILSLSPRDLQKSLDNLKTYSRLWKLTINITKTKVMVFSKNGRRSKNLRFTYDGQIVEIVDEFKYLGVIFKSNGRFISAIKLLHEQARKAMYGIISKARTTDMPIDIQFKLFDTLVLPIMTYSCEIWGYENFVILGKLRLKFCKITLQLRTSSPGYMIYGELGRYH